MNLFNNILKKSKNSNTYISIYTNKENTDKFSLGVVCNYDDDFILLKKISPDAVFDGYSILLIEDVYSIEYDDNYLTKIQSQVKKGVLPIENKIQELLKSNFRFDDMIKLSFKKHFFLSINSIFDRSFVGYIKDFDGDNVIIKNIDEYNKDDGYTLFKISEIERINILDIELNMINSLGNSIK